jgi:hypothetical protein
MSDHMPRARRWWKGLLTGPNFLVLAFAVMVAIVMRSLGKSNGFGSAATWIAIAGMMVEIGIGVAILRRDYWRMPTAPELDSLLTLILLGLSAVATVGLTALTCSAVGAQ